MVLGEPDDAKMQFSTRPFSTKFQRDTINHHRRAKTKSGRTLSHSDFMILAIPGPIRHHHPHLSILFYHLVLDGECRDGSLTARHGFTNSCLMKCTVLRGQLVPYYTKYLLYPGAGGCVNDEGVHLSGRLSSVFGC
jgi:hypothetical protein